VRVGVNTISHEDEMRDLLKSLYDFIVLLVSPNEAFAVELVETRVNTRRRTRMKTRMKTRVKTHVMSLRNVVAESMRVPLEDLLVPAQDLL
jgi:hypothetical protein